jgi:GNAT superfamily N-acetyltransferase
MKNNPCKDIQYGPVSVGDAGPLVQLLVQERISLAGRVDLALCRAFIEDALGGRGPHIMVVKARGRIVGWSIGVINSRRYWISFLARHPAVGIKIPFSWLLQKYLNHREAKAELRVAKKRESDLEGLPAAQYDHWGKNRRHTARLIDTTVLPSFRGTGLGGTLQYHHLRELRKLGIRTAEAYVRVSKSGWLQFNARSGFKVAGRKGHSVLIANDLEHSLGSSG